jgi:hypothetical protein
MMVSKLTERFSHTEAGVKAFEGNESKEWLVATTKQQIVGCLLAMKKF